MNINQQIKFLALFALVMISGALLGQKSGLFTDIQTQQAYTNSTRSMSGLPGPNYFQNKAKYNFDVELDFKHRNINGKGAITYFNHSNDTLEHLVFRLYNNLYKKGVTRLHGAAISDLHDGIALNNLEINGQDGFQMNYFYDDNHTVGYVMLNQFLHPGDSCVITLQWESPLPEKTRRRTGGYFKGSWFIAYWYPQLSVYDDIEGWDESNYTGQYEFYNDFSEFDVRITAPREYMLWATGKLTNEQSIYSADVLNRIDKSRQADSVVAIIEKSGQPFTSLKTKKITWHYMVDSMADFAMAASNEYLWDAVSVPAHKSDTSRVWLNAVYHPSAEYFPFVAEISRESIQLLANEVYRYPFPFPKLTVFHGGPRGMEFPMMINDMEKPSYCQTVYITAHEIGHMYFPFLVGTNERRDAWIDEGLTTFLTKYAEYKMCGYDAMSFFARMYEPIAGTRDDIPLMAPTNRVIDKSYYNSAYGRSSMALFMLEDYLGQDTFRTGLQQFIKHWKYKHPMPYDFFNIMEATAGQDLSWYWKPWFFEYGYPDLRIDTARISTHIIMVEKVGEMPVPVHLTVYYKDDTKQVYHEKMDAWINSDNLIFKTDDTRQIRLIELGTPRIPDANAADNMVWVQQ